LDFVSENLVPGEIRDERVINFQLVPLQPVSTDQLLARAEQLRASGGPPVTVIGPPPASPGVAIPSPGVLAPAEALPEPTTQAPAAGSPPIHGPSIFVPPGSGTLPAPPTNVPVVPAIPPPYNPPQYLPPGSLGR
jgi:hypothetical protein